MATSWHRPPHYREHLPNNIGHLWAFCSFERSERPRRMCHDSPSPFVRRQRLPNTLENTYLTMVYLHFGRSELCVPVSGANYEKCTWGKMRGNEEQTKQNKNAHTDDDANNNNSHRRAHNKLNCRFGHQSVIAIPTHNSNNMHTTTTMQSHGKTHHDRGETPPWVALRFEMAH